MSGSVLEDTPTVRPGVVPSGPFGGRVSWRWIGWIGAVIVLIVTPHVLDAFWTGKVTGWVCLAVAAQGLNLLTGYNGQISAGHGALYGLGAYTCAIWVDHFDGQFLGGVALAAVVSFAAGLLIGLPALRIKGLYLALVTLAVATLFPDLVKQLEGITGGQQGLKMSEPVPYRGTVVQQNVKWVAPEWTGLADDQWRFYVFAVIALACFALTANLVRSRMGRAMVAIRDNEVAAETNGVPVARVKVVTFGLSSALAGVGGALFALWQTQVFPLSFTLTASLYFLVAVVLGGPSSVIGPAIGAISYGLFEDVLSKKVLPERWQSLTPLILGVLLVVLMQLAPGGTVGMVQTLRRRRLARRASGVLQPAGQTVDQATDPATPDDPATDDPVLDDPATPDPTND